MQINTSGDPQQDILPETEFPLPPRSGLIPVWMTIGMALLQFIHFAFLKVSSSMRNTSYPEDDPGFETGYLVVSWSLTILIYLNIAGCILVWNAWKHAIRCTLVPAVLHALLLLAFVSLCLMDESSRKLLAVVVPYFILQTGFVARLFYIQKEWLIRPRK